MRDMVECGMWISECGVERGLARRAREDETGNRLL